MIPPKRPKMMTVVSVKQNPKRKSASLSIPDKHQLRILKQTLRMNDAAANFAGVGKEYARAELKRKFGYSDAEIKRLENPSRMAKAVVALRRKIRAQYTAGMPEDQSTASERKIVRDYPQYFENDYGYIKVKVTGKRRARNPKPLNAKDTDWEKLSAIATLKRGSRANIAEKEKAANVLRSRGYTEAMIRKIWTSSKNPYASEAQRRKFHAMAARGEISQAVVNEFDRESKGLVLPERVNPNDAAFINRLHEIARRKGAYVSGAYVDGGYVYFYDASGYKMRAKKTPKGVSSDWRAVDHPSKPTGRKRNATATDFKQHQKVRLQDLVRKFQGHANGLKHRLLEADTAPKNKYLLGCLALMKVKANGKIIPIKFDGAAYLAADLRNNLHAVGKDAIISNVEKANPGTLRELGKLIQIDYITAKSHIENGETVRFWHKLGEVDSQHPTLYIDQDGFPIINGGGYDIWDVGIVN